MITCLCFYSILDEDILKDLKTCEQIATSGFYGSIIRHSEDSLIPTLEILKKTDADFDSEAIARRYPFEEGGWGSAFRFNDFMKS